MMDKRRLATQIISHPEFGFAFNVAVISDMTHGTFG